MRPVILGSFAFTAVVAAGVLLAGDMGLARQAGLPPSTPVAQSAQAQTLRTVTLKVENLWCASCPVIVRRALERVDGVREAHVSYRTKTATVSYDPARSDVAKLTAATAAIGYPTTVIR